VCRANLHSTGWPYGQADRRAVEKTIASQAWKTLCVSHFSTARDDGFFRNHFIEMLEPPKMAQMVETSFFRT